MQMYRFKCDQEAAICASVLTCIDTSTKRCVNWPLLAATSTPQCDTTPKHIYIAPFHNVRTYACAHNTASYTVQFGHPARSRDAAATSGFQDEHIRFIYTQKTTSFFNSNIYERLVRSHPRVSSQHHSLLLFLLLLLGDSPLSSRAANSFKRERGREEKKNLAGDKCPYSCCRRRRFRAQIVRRALKNNIAVFFPASGAAAPLRAFPDAGAFE